METGQLPRITVITPSLNQGEFIEETIQSVIFQNYPNLEYLIIDGGSTDTTTAIIEKYSNSVSYSISERDRGQADAINKGFQLATGDLVTWVNSDDVLLPGALIAVANRFLESSAEIYLGDCIFFGNNIPKELACQRDVTFENMVRIWEGSRMSWTQPGTFIARRAWREVGELNIDLHYTFDRDLMCRLLKNAKVEYLNIPVAGYRLHKDSKTVAHIENFIEEHILVTAWYAAPELDLDLASAEITLCWGALPYLTRSYGRYDKLAAAKWLVCALGYSWRLIYSRRLLLVAVLLLLPRGLVIWLRRYVRF